MIAPPDINDNSNRTAVRDRLGIATEDIVIAAPGRVHRLSGHRFAVWAASILKIADLPVRLIIQDTGRSARDVVEFAGMTGFAEQVILTGAEWSVSDILSAADIALFPDPDAPPQSAMPAGLPIVAADTPRKVTPAAHNRSVSGENTLLVRSDRPREIAQTLMKIIEDILPATVNDK
ncbi:MAG: glycosyltransferase family 4 protein [Phycisphaerae bacterium]|nr:glycosyltransferase family 4 protein [Phycisphaerae bacterium]